MEDKQSIFSQLEDLYEELCNKSTLTQYTANEARVIAAEAIKLIEAWPEQAKGTGEIKDSAIVMLLQASAVAKKFYENFDYSTGYPRPGAPDPWKAVHFAKDGIECFLESV